MSLVEIREETVGYKGSPVLQDVELSIIAGERIALVGESGSGKTTLLNLIHSKLKGRSSLVPQELGLVQALTVFHNVYIGRLNECSVWRNLRNLLVPLKEDIRSVLPILKLLRMEDKIHSSVGELSGGQQQRTAVGRALFHTGNVLLADEPVSAVDEHQGREILEAISINKPTVVLAMHDRALAIEFADRIIGIKDGRIALDQAALDMKPSDLDHLYQNKN